MKRRFLPLILTVLGVTNIFSYRIHASTSNNNSDEVTILMPAPFADSTEVLVNKFNKDHESKITIKVTRGPLETESVSDLAISSLLLGDSPFDIILIDVTWLPKFAAAGWLEPLNNRVESSQWKALAKGARLGNSYQGKIYRWPFVADMGLLYWRKDLMKQPPTTPAELIKISKELQNKGIVKYGYVWQGRQYEGLSCVFLELINGFGGDWMNNQGEVKLNSKSSQQAVSWLKKLITSGVSPKAVTNFTETEALQAFEIGDAAFMRNWPYAWAELNKNKSAVKGKVGVTTMIAKESKYSTSTLGSWGFSITKGSSKKDQAYKVISYLTNEDSQKYLFTKYGYTPTISNLYKSKNLLKVSPILPILEIALKNAKPRPQTPLYAQISGVLQKHISKIITNKENVKETMEAAQVSTERILSSAGEKR